MFSFKFIVISEKGNALRLRITNNRKKAELALGISMPQESLDKILSGNKGASPLHTSLVRWKRRHDAPILHKVTARAHIRFNALPLFVYLFWCLCFHCLILYALSIGRLFPLC